MTNSKAYDIIISVENKVIAYREKGLKRATPFYPLIIAFFLTVGIIMFGWQLWFTILMLVSACLCSGMFCWLCIDLAMIPKVLIEVKDGNLICYPAKDTKIYFSVNEITLVEHDYKWNGKIIIQSDKQRIKLSWVAKRKQVQHDIERLISRK